MEQLLARSVLPKIPFQLPHDALLRVKIIEPFIHFEGMRL
jgi:hypothetical protein